MIHMVYITSVFLATDDKPTVILQTLSLSSLILVVATAKDLGS